MRGTRLLTTVPLAMITLTSAAAVAQAQYDDDDRAPLVRINTPQGSTGFASFIEPTISLSEDAYVFVISVDLDRNIRVLHPEFPGISVKLNASRDMHLPRFFAGYGDRQRRETTRLGGYASSSYYDDYHMGYSDARGTVIALASRQPFNLAGVTSDGDWHVSALSRIIGARDPQSAASALARQLGARGEPVGRDVYRFSGASRFYSTLYSSAAYDCHPYYGALGFTNGISLFRAAQLKRAGYHVQFIGFDACGQQRFMITGGQDAPIQGPRPPATGAFPRSRVPTHVPRNPTRGTTTAERNPTRGGTTADEASGANARAADRYNERVAPRTSPRERTADRTPDRPRVPDQARPQPARGSFPESDRRRAERVQRERTARAQPQPRSPTAEPSRRDAPPERAQPPVRPAPEPAREATPHRGQTKPIDQ